VVALMEAPLYRSICGGWRTKSQCWSLPW